MKIIVQTWDISQLKDKITCFILNPQYQRLPVWKIDRSTLLIDSIIRGYDLPKFYIKIISKKPEKYEVTDGQQRIRSIISFCNDEFPLSKTAIFGKTNCSGLKFSELPKAIQNKILNFDLSFSEIQTSEKGEVNELFIRLQKGVELTPTEIRHALFSNYGFYLDDFLNEAQIKIIFTEFKIKNIRFKQQEYLDHVMTLLISGKSKDLKSESMFEIYKRYALSEITEFKSHFQKAKLILQKMKLMNNTNPGIFQNKWSFVDMFNLLNSNYGEIKTINYTSLSTRFKKFNENRIKYKKNPEIPLRSRTIDYGKELYSYIQLFDKEASKYANINGRLEALSSLLIDL